jgi:ubiquinone/menaquinone biosynthesis C-methylase UbiE/pimeloyl-ACP methyl ester carboxylesterase
VLIAVVLDVPLLARLVRLVTRAPVVEALDLDGVPVEVHRPPGNASCPAWVFITGAHPLRRREPVVARLAQGLARAGYLVAVPDIPGLGAGTISSRTAEATEAVVRVVCDRPDVHSGRVALIGASTGAGLALLAAGSPDLAKRISVVAAVAPFADLRKLVCLTTTGCYHEDTGFTRHEVTDLHRQVVARSLVAALPPGPDRDRLIAEIARIDDELLNPLDELPRRMAGLAGEAGAVVALLGNRQPERYEELFEQLPKTVRDVVEQLSPLRCRDGIRAPVELVVPPSDVYFPLAEALALANSLPNVQLTVTRTLDHTRPSASITRLRDFAAFGGFVVRGLAAAGQRRGEQESGRAFAVTGEGETPVRAEIPSTARSFLLRERLGELTLEAPVIALRRHEPARNRRFEGLYGRLYNRVIQSPGLRRAAFSIWGSADPLYDLDAFVADAVTDARAMSTAPVLVDLPSGGGTLLPFLAREGFSGTVIEVDLATAMLKRAVALHRSSTPDLKTVFLQGDALDLALGDAVADVVISINGLHVVPDHARFLAELARITKPGGRLWLITPVDGPGARSRAILAAARSLRITPRTPPTLAELRDLLDESGFRQFRSYGGASITGVACDKV